ncbi:MAG: M23 family metallopeptidase [Hyphomicrobiales bacterium]
MSIASMSSSKASLRRSFVPLLATVAALSLSACSSQMDRFADYPNINTNSVSQTQQRAQADTSVQSRPLGNTSVNATKPTWQGYSQQAYTAPPPPPKQPAHVQAANAPAAKPQLASASGMHEVRSGETLYSIARAYKVSPFDLAAANSLPSNYTVKVGEELKIPGGAAAARATAQKTAPAPAATQAAKAEPKKEAAATASEGDQPQTKQVSLAEEEAKQTQPGGADQGAATGDATADGGFRWPVKGKIISAYGQKANGTKNEGINIAVPEGTAVRAAESGVVAYAGSELKGYGNLVLIRHENGWVTAYANNQELLVKRGDAVKRGDVIAKAGQTGSVTSPQVHFELRKGATAVDPVKYLSSATASN